MIRGVRRGLELLVALAMSVAVVCLVAPDAAWAQTCNGRTNGGGPAGPGNDFIDALSGGGVDTVDGGDGFDRCHISVTDKVTNCELFTQ